MPYGGVPTARERLTQMLKDGSLQAMYRAADTEKSIREALGISENVWLQMKKEIPGFKGLSTQSRKQKFLAIKEAMLKNASGFEYEEVRDEIIVDPNTGEEIVGKRVREKKYKAPDLNSQRILLTNIKRAEGNQENPDPEIANFSTRMEEALEIKTEGGFNLTLDASVQSVLEALSGN